MLVNEKMKNNYLIAVTSDDVLKLKVKNVNFLFPIKDLCVGFLQEYTIKDIKTPNSYLFVNRLLDKEALAILETVLKEDLRNIAGICFTDLGAINVVKRLAPGLQLIYLESHNTTNYVSINYYLEYVDSVLISTDITEEEINKILDKAHKPLVLPYFLLAQVMYSRRSLLTNYQSVLNLPNKNQEVLKDSISQEEFLAVENKYGTVFYQNKYLDYRKINHPNILFRYINPLNLTLEELEKVLNNQELDIPVTTGFLDIKTYYNLKEVERL